MITCMEMKSFIVKYASKIMFYDVNIACYQRTRMRWGVPELSGDEGTVGSWIGQVLRWTEVGCVDFPVAQGKWGGER